MAVSELLQEAQAALPKDRKWTRRSRLAWINEYVAKRRYLETLAKVGTSSAGLKAAGVDWRELRKWREQDELFLIGEHQARELLADSLEEEAIRRGRNGVRVPVYQGGVLAGYELKASDQLLITMLKATRPERFRERSEVTVKPIMKVVAGFEPADVL